MTTKSEAAGEKKPIIQDNSGSLSEISLLFFFLCRTPALTVILLF